MPCTTTLLTEVQIEAGKGEPKEKPPMEFFEDLNSIRKVGNILNQIARRAHYQGYIEDEKHYFRIVLWEY